jgi:hypothetical protein
MHHIPSLLSVTLLACAAALPGLEQVAVGPRHLGMGGAGTACPDDYVAQYYNPGAFGFFGLGTGQEDTPGFRADNQDLQRKGWGAGLDVTTGTRIGGDLAKYADQIANLDLSRIRAMGTTQRADPVAVGQLLQIAESLGSLQANRDTVTVDVNAGVGVRIGHFGVGARGFSQATARLILVDKGNLGFASGSENVVDKINTAVNGTTLPTAQANYTPVYFNQAQYNQLVASLGTQSNNANAVNLAAQALDSKASQSGLDPANTFSTLGLLVGDGTAANPGLLSAALSPNALERNLTTVRLSGLAVAEVPISYGYAFNEYISIGGSVKPMVGRVYVTEWKVFQSLDDLESQLRDIQDNYAQSVNVGFDAGVLARMPYLQVGVTGRNLNSPSFKGPTIANLKYADQKVEATVTAGVAIIPLSTLTVAADCDLIETGTTLPGYATQRVSGGAEWNAFRFLALRAGLSSNLAEDDVGLMYHAGIGLNLWALRIDLAGSMSKETVEYDGDEIPREARAALAIATDW